MTHGKIKRSSSPKLLGISAHEANKRASKAESDWDDLTPTEKKSRKRAQKVHDARNVAQKANYRDSKRRSSSKKYLNQK